MNGYSPLTCEECGYTGPEVATIGCGYAEDVHGVYREETICPGCEHEHVMDI